jgi:hypothetical protein
VVTYSVWKFLRNRGVYGKVKKYKELWIMNCLNKESPPGAALFSVQPAAGQDLHPGTQVGGFSVHTNRRLVTALFAFGMVFLLLTSPALTAAQVERYPQSSRDFRFSAAVSPFYRFSANVDGGGTLSVTSVYFNASVIKQINKKLGLGLGFIYEFDDFNFSGLTGFPVARPWSEVQRLGFSIPIFYSLTEKWKLVIVPTTQFSGEFGARVSQAMVYGGSAGVSYTFGPKATLGVGVAGYDNLEETRVFPFPIIKLKLSDRIRLTNPFRTSPAGPAGLEFSYVLTSNWEVGIGGAYRSYRFRLDHNGPLPDGIGEYKSVPVFVRLSLKPLPAFGIDVYGGVSFLNKLYVEDEDGNELFKTKHDVAPLVGATLSGRF